MSPNLESGPIKSGSRYEKINGVGVTLEECRYETLIIATKSSLLVQGLSRGCESSPSSVLIIHNSSKGLENDKHSRKLRNELNG